VLRYLKNNTSLGITYKKQPKDSVAFQLVGYSNADYAVIEDRKSVFRYLFTLTGGAIAFTSKKQVTVVLLTIKAELITLNKAGKEAVFLY
jgi:hypothetical protein